MSTATDPQNSPVTTPPAPAPVRTTSGAAPVSAVAFLAVVVLLLAAGFAAYLVYAHPGAKEPFAAAFVVLAVLVPVTLTAFRR